jgi:type I restriction enzyme M protein
LALQGGALLHTGHGVIPVLRRLIVDAIKTKGYFIYPSQLFCNVVAKANNNENLNNDLATIFSAIESSANGYPSEVDIKGLFADFDTTSNRLGNTVFPCMAS